MTLSAVGDAIRAAGYSTATHRVVSRASYADGVTFARAYLREDRVVSLTPWRQLVDRLVDTNTRSKTIQAINITKLLKNCTNLNSAACGFAHRS
jgi:hypothetical protein